MRQLSQDLIDHLNTATQFLKAELFEFNTRAGQLRLTDHDRALKDGDTWYAPWVIERNRLRITAGLEVDELVVTIYPRTSDRLGGMSFLEAVSAGYLDGASFTLKRAHFGPTWDTCIGSSTRFVGMVGDISDFTRTEVPLSIKSILELLSIKIPRNVYQASCRRVLYDAGCKVVKDAFGAPGHVMGGATVGSIPCTFGEKQYANDYFAAGTITFSSGKNAGLTRTVKTSVSNRITPALPFPYAPNYGDTFVAWPGCDQTMNTCLTKFGNLKYYDAEPFVPAAETAL